MSSARPRTSLRRLVRVLLPMLLLGGFAFFIDWREVWSATRALDPVAATIGVLLVGVGYPLTALRLTWLLRAQRIPANYAWTHGLTWIGQFYNALLPTGIGGDAVRLFHVIRLAPDRRTGAIFALVQDRIWGLLSLLLLGLAALITYAARGGDARAAAQIVPSLGITFLAVLAFAVLVRRFPPRRWPRRVRALGLRGLGRNGWRALAEIWRLEDHAPASRVALLLCSCVVWITEFAGVWWLAQACGLPLSWPIACLAVVGGTFATLVPVGVGGHGLREGALIGAVFFFDRATATRFPEEGVLLALIYLAATLGWSLCGGLVQVASAAGWLPPGKTGLAQPVATQRTT